MAPRRHESAPQQSALDEQPLRAGAHMQEPTPKLQSAPQLPSEGPPDAPVEHVFVAPHQPQPLVPVQEPQLVCPAQGSGAGQEEDSQLHPDAQVPELGPVRVPTWQVSVAPHQPQSSSPVHPPQVVWAPQSLPPSQRSPNQSQSAQVPAFGPLEVPTRQLFELGHQPQLAREVHSSQSVALEHGSGPPVHWLGSQVQLLQEPTLGPVADPVPQVPVSPHQPHG